MASKISAIANVQGMASINVEKGRRVSLDHLVSVIAKQINVSTFRQLKKWKQSGVLRDYVKISIFDHAFFKSFGQRRNTDYKQITSR